MNKITLTGFANNFATIQAPTHWVAKKTAVAWANGPSIKSSKQGGATVADIADRYSVSIPTIYKILKAQAWASKPVHSVYRAELTAARKKMERMAAQLDDARHDLANAQLGEAAAIARLNDPSMANKWKNEAHIEHLRCEEAKADRDAAEAQITMMAERLAECRGRGFWARLFNT
tara:strand:- start:929 stop:1453 length:525 start_codon:yes stop_codon:yes gene_type:complete